MSVHNISKNTGETIKTLLDHRGLIKILHIFPPQKKYGSILKPFESDAHVSSTKRQ